MDIKGSDIKHCNIWDVTVKFDGVETKNPYQYIICEEQTLDAMLTG
jgi:hypothetical protein